MQTLIVTAAIIIHKNKILITQRPAGKHNGMRWEFPGGKLEFCEDPRACLEREINEELGITIRAGKLLDYSSHVYDGEKHVLLLGFLCDYIGGTLEKKQVHDVAWVTAQEMSNYDITEADVPFVKLLTPDTLP